MDSPGLIRRPAGLLGCVGIAVPVVGLVLFQNYRKAQAGAAPEVAAASAPRSPGQCGSARTASISPLRWSCSLDIRMCAAAAATRPRPLPPFTGVLAPDNDRLARVHTRFAGEVVSAGHPGGEGNY